MSKGDGILMIIIAILLVALVFFTMNIEYLFPVTP